MSRDRIRLAYIVSHPIQYQAPLFRLLASQPELDFKVFFLHQHSVRTHFDKGFGQAITWDVPLLEGYDHEALPSHGPGKLSEFLHSGIEQRLRSGRFQVLWIHGYIHPTQIRAIRLANRLGIKVLMRGESNLLAQPPSGMKVAVKRVYLNWLFRQVFGFLCIGTLNREFYRSYGVSEDRLFCMPYAVDNDFFSQRVAQTRPERESLRASLGLQPGRPVVLFTGKLLPHKGPMDLLEAYTKLSRNGAEPRPYLLFAGDGILRSDLEARAKATGWSSIRFLGFQNQTQLPRIFDLCDLFVLPSHFEPWGLVVNEVMNAGKAVILSSAAGCAPDLAIPGVNGFSFRAGDVPDLASALERALDDPARLEAMGLQSLKRISQWGFRENIEGLLTACRAVLDMPDPQAAPASAEEVSAR